MKTNERNYFYQTSLNDSVPWPQSSGSMEGNNLYSDYLLKQYKKKTRHFITKSYNISCKQNYIFLIIWYRGLYQYNNCVTPDRCNKVWINNDYKNSIVIVITKHNACQNQLVTDKLMNIRCQLVSNFSGPVVLFHWTGYWG